MCVCNERVGIILVIQVDAVRLEEVMPASIYTIARRASYQVDIQDGVDARELDSCCTQSRSARTFDEKASRDAQVTGTATRSFRASRPQCKDRWLMTARFQPEARHMGIQISYRVTYESSTSTKLGRWYRR